MARQILQGTMKWGLLMVLLFLVAGCFARSKPQYLVEQYTIEYPSPVIQGLSGLPAPVRVDRFLVGHTYNSRAMMYKSDPYKVAAYDYSRWRVNPGDMVTDFFLRDLRVAAIFPAVFSYRNTEGSRFLVEGGVEEFLHLTQKNGGMAVLGLTLTLIDESQQEATKRILFQKRYRITEPTVDHTPEAFAKAMSLAMSRLSEEIIRDVHGAAARRLSHQL
jgi:ABC-type uncharacterized transport system auxiliary subunit